MKYAAIVGAFLVAAPALCPQNQTANRSAAAFEQSSASALLSNNDALALLAADSGFRVPLGGARAITEALIRRLEEA